MVGAPTTELGLERNLYLVAGLGRAGYSAANTLLALVPPERIRAWDHTTGPVVNERARSLGRAGIQTTIGADGLSLLEQQPGVTTIVTSPGIPSTVPLLAHARSLGIPIIDELELGWRILRSPTVAVTGTNGKSTTCALIAAALSADGRTAIVSGNTEFGPPLSTAAMDNFDAVVCEVSSFQMERCPTFSPDVAVFTNLARDHLGRHGDMASYAACKQRLFIGDSRPVAHAIVNTDDRFGRMLAREARALGARVTSYGRRFPATYQMTDCRSSLQHSRFTIRTPQGPIELRTRLPGVCNAYNATAALAAACAIGIDTPTAARAIATSPGLPGRFEVLPGRQPFDVVVDFAHNPAGLREALAVSRHVVRRRGTRLRAVVSALASDDAGKRQLMGLVAGGMADQLILTSEMIAAGSSSDEQIEQLERGARFHIAPAALHVIPDRRSAIRAALDHGRPGDVVAIFGRGAQAGPLVDLSGRARPFDDRVVARSIMVKRYGASTPPPAVPATVVA